MFDSVPFQIDFTLEGFGGTDGRLLAVEARTAHDRFGLTHETILRAEHPNGKLIPRAVGLSPHESAIDDRLGVHGAGNQ